MNFVNKIFRGEMTIWIIFMFICLISIIEVFSATSTLTYKQGYLYPMMRHACFLLAGTGAVLMIHACKPRFLSSIGLLLPVAWVLLFILLICDKLDWGFIKIISENRASRWIEILGIRFQPSEIAKLSLVTLTAFLLSKFTGENTRILKWILVLTGVTCALIIKENGSTAILLALVIYFMLLIGRIPKKYKLWVTVALVSSAAVCYAFIRYTPSDILRAKPISIVLPRAALWQERILAEKPDVRDPNFKIDDDNYQVSHANIAIARGGVVRILPGSSVERDFLPQAYSDFIYAIIIEEWGLLLGGFFVLFLYIALFIRAGIIANRCERFFPKYLVMGSALILVSQALANMAVAVNLIPVTGQPLPLISRGGTSTIINCIYIGIILSVSRFGNPKGIARDEEIAAENANAEVEKLLNEDLNIEAPEETEKTEIYES